ncbi:MAG: retropepsin-like aspartic protease [Candidatus Angelobacter sp.]
MTIAATKTLGLSVSLLFCAALAAAQRTTTDSTNTLPARTVQSYLMVVSVTINDRGPYDFLVDTGTNTTLIDPALAGELTLQPKDRLQLSSLASSRAVPRYFLQKFTAGPASISNLEALAVPLTQLNALDNRIRGVLGMNFLLHFSFRLDFDRHAMELYPFPENAEVPPGLRVPVVINESRLLISVSSDAAPRGTWNLALDSGISQPLVFEQRIAQAAVSHGSRKTSRVMQVSTNLAEHSAYTLQLDDVTIAEARLPQIEMVVLRNEQQKNSDPQDGLLPAVMFHSVFFDRATATLVFTPSTEGESSAFLQRP